MPQNRMLPESASSRPLGNLEVFFKMLADTGMPFHREHWTIHAALRLVFNSPITDLIPYLQRPWGLLQRKHPALGATIGGDGPNTGKERPRLMVAEWELDTWVRDTFTICHDRESAQDLFPTLYSTATATCYWIPASSELVIRSSHWRIDGIGMALLCHDFMSALASVMQRGLDVSLGESAVSFNGPSGVAPTLEALAQAQSHLALRTDDDEEHPTLAAGADLLVAEFIRGVPSIGLPTKPGSSDSPPGASGCAVTSLSTATTARLAAACKEKGLKVVSAVHAALVRATAGFPQHPLCKSYAAFVPVDLRALLEATATEETKGTSKVVGLYFSGLPVCIDQVKSDVDSDIKDFDTISRNLEAVYGRDRLRFWSPSDGDGQMFSLLDLAQPYLRRTTQLFDTPVPDGLPPVQTPDLSSVGKVETYLRAEYGTAESGKVEVAGFWIGTEMLNRSVQFHTWSWRGQFYLGACFNSSFYENEFLAEVLEKVVRELAIGCDIE